MTTIKKAKNAPDPNVEQVGPWMGVPAELQDLCAVADCETKGKPQICIADGANHHHGCIHYERLGEKAGLVFRKGGWCWLCDEHYAQLKEANPNARGAR